MIKDGIIWSLNQITIQQNVKVVMHKQVYLSFLILGLCEIEMHECWFNYFKDKYGDDGKFCYIDTDNFIIDLETIDSFENVKDDVEERYYPSDYEVERPLPLGKNKKL